MKPRVKNTVKTTPVKRLSITQKLSWQAKHHGAFTQIANSMALTPQHVREVFWGRRKSAAVDAAIREYMRLDDCGDCRRLASCQLASICAKGGRK